jgi:hypothetical protein
MPGESPPEVSTAMRRGGETLDVVIAWEASAN